MLGGIEASASTRKWVGPLHSHNDYERSAPLEVAIRSGFESVEADIWRWGNDLQIGHIPLIFKGSLRDLYLYPLLFQVMRNGGSVHGDGRTFYLWIEFKDGCPESVDLLAEELSRFPIFTEFTDQGIKWGAVTVVLTGNEKNKQRFVSRPGVRLATRDSEWISSSDPVGNPSQGNDWLWYGLDWKDHFDWDAKSPISEQELARLRGLLSDAHALGRKVRFFNAPDRKAFWKLAHHEGFDLVGTDRVEALSRYWQSLR